MSGFRVSNDVMDDFLKIRLWCDKNQIPFNRLFNNIVHYLALQLDDIDLNESRVFDITVRFPNKIGERQTRYYSTPHLDSEPQTEKY
jgi:hypothetical protein